MRENIELIESPIGPKTQGLYSENISEGGLFITTNYFFFVGTPVFIRIPLRIGGKLHIIDAHCEVRWVRKKSSSYQILPGIGVTFTEIKDSDVDLIKQFVEELI